jgi:hypothetical protein
MSEVFSLLIVEEAKAECETGHTSAGSQSSNNLAQEKLLNLGPVMKPV